MPTPTPAPSLTPTALLAAQSTTSPPTPPTPTASPAPIATPTPEPEQNQVQQLIQLAREISEQDPCRAADLLHQALDAEDAPDIEDLRQTMLARCNQLTATPPIQLNSPLPTPPTQRIAYTSYDIASGVYSIQTWDLGNHLPGPKLMDWAMQPAFGPRGAIIFRSVATDSPGIYLIPSDGDLRRITKGADDRWPRWGPGGQQIIFTSARRSPDGSPHLYLADISTRAVEDLGPGQHADWSRTGQIIFSDCDAGGQNCGLWLLDPTTLQRTQITAVPDDSNPVWSPDGRSIAFLSNRDGDWAVYAWRLNDLTTTRLFPVGTELPNWQQAGLDWGS